MPTLNHAVSILRKLGDVNTDCHRMVLDKIHPCLATIAQSTGLHWETVLDHWLSSRKAFERLVHPAQFTELMNHTLDNEMCGRNEQHYAVQLAMERSRWYLNWLRRKWFGPKPTSGSLGVYNWRGRVRIAGLLPYRYDHDKQDLQAACAANGVQWRASWTKKRLWQALLKAAPRCKTRISAAK